MLLATALVVVLFEAAGNVFFDDYLLDLGRITVPGPLYSNVAAVWFVFGTVMAGLLTASLVFFRGPAPGIGAIVRGYRWIPDGAWVAAVMVIAFLIPTAIRALVLRDVPVVDDEHPYRFMAHLLAQGELWADSPPIAEAFDRKFMINWGKFYSQYFLGWPALMVPAVWAGWPDYANAAYSALTVLPVFYVVKRYTNSSIAKGVSLAYLTAPMLMLGASTAMAHTTCLAGLAYMHWAVLRSADDDAPLWSHAAVALCFGVTFFIRPTPAIGGGVPLLLYWFARTIRRSPRHAAGAVFAFAIPGLAMGGLFLGVNYLQNGGLFKTAYARAIEFAHHIGFGEWGGPRREDPTEFFRGLKNPAAIFATSATALFRLNCSLFGWPSSYLFAAVALGRPGAWLPAWMFAGLFAIHSFVISVGVDTFGPVKYFEAAWPLIVLTGIGLKRAIDYFQEIQATGERLPIRLDVIPPMLMVALIVTSLGGYSRFRLQALRNIGDSINIPMDALKEAKIHQAVIFAPRGFSPRKCSRKPTRHFLYQQPMNRPDFSDDILWANHRGRTFDLQVMQLFPERTGYIMRWTKHCKVVYDPLNSPPAPALRKHAQPSRSGGDKPIAPGKRSPAGAQAKRARDLGKALQLGDPRKGKGPPARKPNAPKAKAPKPKDDEGNQKPR